MSQKEKIQRQALEKTAEVKRIFYAAEQAFKNRKPATLLVTSAIQGEGKSLFAATLAVTAAQSGKYRVAALDLNWYRPTLHRFFDVEKNHSSREIFDFELCDLVCPSGLDSLDILTAPSDDADQHATSDLALHKINRLIEQAKSFYDLIVVDSASIFPTNSMIMDPVMLSGVADGVAMVVAIASTPRQMARKAQKTMESVEANILGIVANQRTVRKNG